MGHFLARGFPWTFSFAERKLASWSIQVIGKRSTSTRLRLVVLRKNKILCNKFCSPMLQVIFRQMWANEPLNCTFSRTFQLGEIWRNRSLPGNVGDATPLGVFLDECSDLKPLSYGLLGSETEVRGYFIGIFIESSIYMPFHFRTVSYGACHGD